MGIAIQAEHVGKQYFIGHQPRPESLRDLVAHGVRAALGRFLQRNRPATIERFWALDDVSFTINHGEVVGIIGRNGAGKSTLLKILSRITEPTKGRVRLRGRVASLLEVGTGFHPDLSGRENIFLNGAVLGMSRAEIVRKFDEIVAFAEVEKFLDTPVRRYSSGMRMRLAFAVAAHLEPEILIVDEVLAVGDADFQRKCLRKMDDVTRHEGRTILFVSHQLSAVQQLCNRALVLNRGVLTHDTSVAEGIAAYCAETSGATGFKSEALLGSELEMTAFEAAPSPMRVFDDVTFHIRLRAAGDTTIHELSLLIHDEQRQRVALADLRDSASSYRVGAGRSLEFRGTIKRLALVPGRYAVGLHVRTARDIHRRDAIATIEVHAAARGLIGYTREHLGSVALDTTFTVSELPE